MGTYLAAVLVSGGRNHRQCRTERRDLLQVGSRENRPNQAVTDLLTNVSS